MTITSSNSDSLVLDKGSTFVTDRRGVLGVGASLAASLAWSPTSSAAAVPSEMDDLLDRSAAAYGTVGYSVAVLRRGKPVYARHAGVANRETGEPISDRSIYPIFSITKLFTIVELLKARQAGLLDFNIPLGAIRAGLPPAWAGITLAQAIAHVSGLPDYSPDYVEPTEEQAFAAIEKLPMRFATGTSNEYNQTNFLFARKALERATRTPLLTLVGHQFAAVGMPATSYHAEGQPARPSVVFNYRPAPDRAKPAIIFTPPTWPAWTFASRGAFTTLADMTRWTQALLRGFLLPLAPLRESWSPVFMPSGKPAWHTHGWEYDHHDDVAIVGHGGDVRLVWQHYFRLADPDDSATVIYLDNGGRKTFDRYRLASLLADRVMPGAARPEELQQEALFRGLATGQWDSAIASTCATAQSNRIEAVVNHVGYDAKNFLDVNAALLAFQWNAQHFPQSANAFDSLGEAYRAAGKVDQATASYKRALTLDPTNVRVKAALHQLDPATAPR